MNESLLANDATKDIYLAVDEEQPPQQQHRQQLQEEGGGSSYIDETPASAPSRAPTPSSDQTCISIFNYAYSNGLGSLSDLIENILLLEFAHPKFSGEFIFAAFIVFDILDKFIHDSSLFSSFFTPLVCMLEAIQAVLYIYFCGYATTPAVVFTLIFVFQLIGIYSTTCAGITEYSKSKKLLPKRVFVVIVVDILGFVYTLASTTSPFSSQYFSILLVLYIWTSMNAYENSTFFIALLRGHHSIQELCTNTSQIIGAIIHTILFLYIRIFFFISFVLSVDMLVWNKADQSDADKGLYIFSIIVEVFIVLSLYPFIYAIRNNIIFNKAQM